MVKIGLVVNIIYIICKLYLNKCVNKVFLMLGSNYVFELFFVLFLLKIRKTIKKLFFDGKNTSFARCSIFRRSTKYFYTYF